MSKLALGITVFHGAWIVVLLAMPFAPSSWGIWKRLPAITTIIAQIIFLGCPLTLLADRLNDRPKGVSFTVMTLQHLGLRIAEWHVFVALALITLATFIGLNSHDRRS